MRFVVWVFLVGFAFASSEVFHPIKILDYDARKAELGKELFSDTRLSRDGSLSCEKCHNLYWSLSGSVDYSTRVSVSTFINPPTVLNAALNYIYFKDGRVRNITAQVRESITDPNQLNSSKEIVEERLNSSLRYRNKFNEIYQDGVSFDNVVDVIVHFEKSLITPNSKYDRFMQGDLGVFDDAEKMGFELFQTSGCSTCHNGINLGSNVLYDLKTKGYSTRIESGYSKVPSLRNIARTYPYFYNGSEPDLRSAIRHITQIKVLKELDESEVDSLYKFLLTLNGDKPKILR